MMGCDRENEKAEPLATETADPSQKLADTDLVSIKDGIPSDATSSMSASGNVTSGIKGEESVVYGSEALPCHSWVSTSVDVRNGTTNRSATPKIGPQSSALEKQANLKAAVRTGSLTSKSIPASRTDIKMLHKAPLHSNFSSAGFPRAYQPMGRFSSLANHMSRDKFYRNGESQMSRDKFYRNEESQMSRDKFHRNGESQMSRERFYRNVESQNFPLHSTFSPGYYRQHGRVSNVKDNHMSRDKFYRNGESQMSTELTRGPRGGDKNSSLQSPSVKEEFGFSICRDQYNLSDFQTEYQDAKFYMIKSFNEDDIHKCIKYDVWTSTPYGNKKLNAAFNDAEARTNKTGTKCPVFLFFSVNTSGQFVGVAEMIGPVDFRKDLDFWKIDKYNGFFPIKWHIIKDVPNSQFWHITLENNDNRSVTFSRDTQEIRLKQGLEMLNIFKRYSAKTSLLDDFDFYENREKLFRSQKSTKQTTPQRDIASNHSYQAVKAGDKKIELQSGGPKKFSSSTSLVNLTKKLSLNPSSVDSKILQSPVANSVSSTSAPYPSPPS